MSRLLPPLVGRKVAQRIYSPRLGSEDDFDFQVRSQTGSLLRGSTSDALALDFSLVGYHDWRLWVSALALTSPGDTIIEIGANIGTETVGLSDIVGSTGRVLAFEPFPSSLAALERTLGLIRYRNVEVFPYAVSDREAAVRLHVPGKDPSRARILTDVRDSDTVVEAVSVTLDSLEHLLGTPQMLFIDVEGSEVNVLRGGASMILHNKPHIFIEANPSALNALGFSARELKDELVRLGYTVAKIERIGLSTVTETEFPGHHNWICVQQPQELRRVQRSLRVCAFLPCIPLLHPLTRPRLAKVQQ